MYEGLQVCRLLKEIEPKEVYTVVSSADLSLNSNGKPLCTIAKTNIIAIKEYK